MTGVAAKTILTAYALSFTDFRSCYEEGVNMRKAPSVCIGGPRLQQEPEELHDAFEARVTAVAKQVKKQNE